jgi:[ribosomal protein S5]-alanine N-acetyltransferase
LDAESCARHARAFVRAAPLARTFSRGQSPNDCLPTRAQNSHFRFRRQHRTMAPLTQPLHLSLEPRTAAHADELFALLSDPALYTWLDLGPPADVTALRQQFARSESRRSPDGSEQWLNWVLRDAVSGQALGMVQATVAADGDTNVAYTVGRAFWGQGVARAAVVQMLDLVSADWPRACFVVRAERDNLRSVRLALGLGFEPASDDRVARYALTPSEVLLTRPASR